MHIITIMKLGNMKVRDKLIPMLESPVVDRVTSIRHADVAIDLPGFDQVTHDVGIDPAGITGTWFDRLRNLWRCFRSGVQVARQEHPDLVLGFSLTPYGLIAWLVGKRTGIPVGVSLIGADFNVFVKSPITGPFLRWILRSFDLVVVFGEDAREQLIGYGIQEQRIFTLHNTANTYLFKPDTDVVKDVDIIYTGYLKPHKHVDTLLHALAKVREQRPQTNAMIVGEGEARTELEALAEKLGLSDMVTFCGWSEDVAHLLQRSRMLVSLADREGLPMAMIEALVTGLPVVVTDVGAIHTVVKDGENGYLIPEPADADLVADRILTLLNDDSLYTKMSEGAYAVRQTHGYEHGTQVWTTILGGMQK